MLAWQAAAPNSVVDNLYGPTEATVDCAGQRLEPGEEPVLTIDREVLAIGWPHPGTELAIFSEDRRPLPSGERGEIAIAGQQLSDGYLNAPDLTADRFPVIEGKRWYLTGDIGMRDDSGMFHHLGRIDNQIKIQGYRVELEDIEAQMRTIVGATSVAAVAWPIKDGVAMGLVGFVSGGAIPVSRVRQVLRHRLPAYMVPARIYELETLPLNSSGKIDRRALVQRLEGVRE